MRSIARRSRHWRGHILSACVIALALTGTAVLAQTRRQPVPAGVNDPAGIEVSHLGVKVAPVPGVTADGRVVTQTQITAVRQDGPAFLAGLQPGDIITRTGTLVDPTPQALASPGWIHAAGRRLARQAYGLVEIIDVEARYSAKGASMPWKAAVRLWIASAGTWITTTLDHTNAPDSPRQELPGVAQARAAQARYDAQYAETLDQIAADPCGTAGRTDPLASALEKPPPGYSSSHMLRDNFRGMAFTGCANVKDPLPEFESLLVAIVLGYVDACAYTPGSDVGRALARARLHLTKESYDRHIGPELPHAPWLAENVCARELIVSRLTNRPFVAPRR